MKNKEKVIDKIYKMSDSDNAIHNTKSQRQMGAQN